MATQFEIDCALMAGASYISTRPDINKFPTPVGWETIPNSYFNDPSTGFEAVAFQSQCSNDIVISYAGTGTAIDWTANFGLATGFGSDQLLQAAEYYLQVKAANPNANITFTGHSLGGGLASLMGVFFNQTAVTFDQAPFLNSATQSIAMDVLADLVAKFPVATYPQISSWLSPLTRFIAPVDLLADSLPVRASKVTDINVQGEVLSSAPVTLYRRIGTQTDIANSSNGVSGTDLHAQSLLTAFLQSQQTAATGKALNDVTSNLTDLLGMIFDKNLYYNDPNNKNNPQRNFLENLVRHEAGVQGSFAADAMVTRFTTDLWKVAQDGGLTLTDANVAKALTAFAMQMYYENPNATDASKQLFSDIDVSGGLRFNREDVAVSLSDAKGYASYFLAYLQENFTGSELDKIIPSLPDLKDWYIQAGTNSLNATDTQNRGAFMLGGSGDDRLTGGSQADLLICNGGNDTLDGRDGAVTDVLAGGKGDDVYYIDAIGGDQDKIIEEAGGGKDTVRAKGTYKLADNVENLELLEAANIDGTGNQSDNKLVGNSGVNRLDGGEGNDWLEGKDGDDWLIGGAGDDTLIGGTGSNRLEGGAGYDTYVVEGNADIFAQGDWLTGGAANDYNYDLERRAA